MTWNNRESVWKQRHYDGPLTGQWAHQGREWQPSVCAHSIWMTLYIPYYVRAWILTSLVISCIYMLFIMWFPDIFKIHTDFQQSVMNTEWSFRYSRPNNIYFTCLYIYKNRLEMFVQIQVTVIIPLCTPFDITWQSDSPPSIVMQNEPNRSLYKHFKPIGYFTFRK